MINATRLAAKIILENIEEISIELKSSLLRLANTKQTLDHFKELNAMKKLENTFKKENISTDNICQQSVQKLVEIVWRYTSMYYFWIKK